jgi:hypothetical protein
VLCFDTNGAFLKQVSVGSLPDMIVFTPDGTKVLTANEGQPNDTYTIDPEGSVSVIDTSGGIANLPQCYNFSFQSYNPRSFTAKRHPKSKSIKYILLKI